MAYTTINKSTDYFNTKLYTGTGSSNAQTGVGFQPDWTWIKERASAGHDHNLFDAVRGVTKSIKSNTSGAQTTDAQDLKTFDSDGFTLGTNGGINENNVTFASWNWKANGAGSSNTDGSITSTVSASTTSGFSIVKWTANAGTATIGHGLNAVPKMIIVKSLANATTWMVQHSSLGSGKEIYLNNTSAANNSTAWNSTDPTSTVFTVTGGAGDGVNASGDYVAYCFADIKGFSKFGSYVGNGNADGAFIYTGFKPAFVIIKRYDSGTLDWNMYDSKRLGYNGGDAPLFADLNNSESNDYGRIDFVSNGFKIRTSNDQLANNGGKFLYMCFAEAPLVGSNNIPSTAR